MSFVKLQNDNGDLVFTGTSIRGFTPTMIGLGNVNNTSDTNKPVSTATQTSLNLKSDKSYVDASLNLKSDKSYVDASLNLKSDKSYVDASLNLKSDKTYVDASLNLKADKTYVDASLNLKADKTYVDGLSSGITYYDSSLNITNSADFTSDNYMLILTVPSLPAGTYTIVGTIGVTLNSTISQTQFILSNSQFTFGPGRTYYYTYNNMSSATSSSGFTHSTVLNGVFTLSQTTTVYLHGLYTFSGGSGTVKTITNNATTQFKLLKIA
jgi:hypothetical protein